ncbi:MAG: PASTA domain-containing protein [Peptococcaceae bacterium]|nr:PASTA domain-containing protein [Peptococcaceae bacterium]
MKNRMQIVLLIFCIVIVGITAKLGYEQMFHASQLENGALNARLREIDIKPNRGAVYDHNGNAIAISIATESVYINPKTVRSADERVNNRQDKEEVIRTLASVLELDEEAVAEKVEQNVSFAYIKRHITDEQAEVLHKLGYKGVYFLEESRRSYPKGTLASQIVGFAGIDNQGLNGIELQYDNTLLGNPGKFLMEYDGAGNEIPQATESYIPSEPGCDVYLTIDETIQYIVERELKNVVQEQDAVGATAIVMNVKTGSVLGMANYPDYNPNDYGSVDSSLWSNFAVNGLYEPGSTFKILTTAMALEERVTTLNEGFYCAGYQYIGKMKMRCHKAAGHGAESFTQGVANSCNPVFVEVSRRLGMEKFYDYLEGFGMTQPTGIDLPGEADSLIVPEKSAVPYDLAAMAIGQSNAFTPMQMITAISAVANGGQLMKPYIVEKIVDPDGNIVQERQPEVVRQVISEQTAREVWAALETVVSSGTGKQGQIEGYTVAGKTGTAEKVANGTYSSARMVSFAGFAPADNPQIACLVIVDEPNDAHGGSTAGPVFQNIMEDTLRYLEVPKNVTVNKTTTVEEVPVPSLENMHPVEAIEAVKAAGLTPIVETQGDALLTYVPAAGTNVQKTGNVYLYCGSSESTQIVMPSLYGRTIKEVDRILAGIGLSGTMNGSGLCTGQSISPGQLVERGTAVIVDFQTTAQVEAAQAVAEGEGLTEEGTAAVDGEV